MKDYPEILDFFI